MFAFYSTSFPFIPEQTEGSSMVKDVVKCFMCAVKGVEKTFNSYDDFQDHLYKDHDMHKDPAMDIYNKYKASDAKTDTTTARR